MPKSCWPRFQKIVFEDLAHMLSVLMPMHPQQAVNRGRLCGPCFMGFEPTCYERGDFMAAMAAGARLLVLPPCHWFLDEEKGVIYDFVEEFKILTKLARALFPSLYMPLEKWSRQAVLDHQRVAAKRLALERSYAEIDDGWLLKPQDLMRVKPFVKAEKDIRKEFMKGTEILVDKAKGVPRCINPVHPHVLAHCAPYTYPMTKRLNTLFNSQEHIFYAAGATPDQINDFLNAAIETNRFVLEDDVSMADGSHSKGSFSFQHNILDEQWPNLESYIRDVFSEMVNGRLSVGRFRAFIQFVNLSEVPLTSWSNTVTFAFVRLVAFALVFCFAERLEDLTVKHLQDLLHLIYMAIAGDDGKTFLPPSINGVSIFDAGFLERYSNAWALFGFSVPSDKIRCFDDSNWRLSTFLAMRPVWSGARYEYGVEIARRLKPMFWQIDNNMHPIAWARGICISLLTCSRHVPVVRLVCDWYLKNTSGAAIDAEFTNPYSTFYGYKVQGDLTERAIDEFCQDYGVPKSVYQDFASLLDRTHDVLVNITHPLLVTVFEKE
jgi:hypothetical protein